MRTSLIPNPHLVFLTRHYTAAGQEPEAPLTTEGETQARELSDFLSAQLPGRIVSSPFLRAQQSILSLAVKIESDSRFVERDLGATTDGDWRGALTRSFQDSELFLAGGESSETATVRGRSAVDDIFAELKAPTVLVTHGNLSLIRMYSI